MQVCGPAEGCIATHCNAAKPRGSSANSGTGRAPHLRVALGRGVALLLLEDRVEALDQVERQAHARRLRRVGQRLGGGGGNERDVSHGERWPIANPQGLRTLCPTRKHSDVDAIHAATGLTWSTMNMVISRTTRASWPRLMFLRQWCRISHSVMTAWGRSASIDARPTPWDISVDTCLWFVWVV